MIWNELADSAKKKFGSDVDLSPHAPLGVLLEMVSHQAESIWLSVEHVASSLFVSLASGFYLDSLLALRGTIRNPGSAAQTILTFTGLPGVIIPRDTLIQHFLDKSIVFVTAKEALISQQSTVKILAKSVQKGVLQNVPAKTLSLCLSPIEGVFSVNNEEPALQGMDPETDEQLKERFFSLSSTVNTSVFGLTNAFSALPKATYVRVLENASEQASDSLPPKSIHVIVAGPPDDVVGQILYQYKPAGIATYGNTAVSYLDQSYQFSRPSKKNIHLEVTIAKCAVTQQTWDQTGKAALQQALQQWLSPSDNPIINISKQLDAKVLARQCAAHPLIDQGVTVLLGTSQQDINQVSMQLLPYEYPHAEATNIAINVSEYAS